MNSDPKNNYIKPERQNCLGFKQWKCRSIHIKFIPDFIELDYTKTYFNFMDFASAIGGVSATISVVLGAVGFIWAVNYAYQLSSIIKRNNRLKFRLYLLKKLEKDIPQIKQKMEDKKKNNSDVTEDEKKLQQATSLETETKEDQKLKVEILLGLKKKYITEGQGT